jgi:hypothetical protein
MADVAPGIITNGLGGSHSNMIAGFFHLGALEVIIGSPPVPPEPPVSPPIANRGGGGAGAPRPWPDQTRDWDIDNPRSIIVRIKYKETTIERLYVVSKDKADFVIKVLNFVTKTRERIKVTISNIKTKVATVAVKFKGNKEK